MSSLYSQLKDAVRPAIAKWQSLLHRGEQFRFRGKEYPYFFCAYNSTWRNERVVEIPVLEDFLRGVPEEEILEIGNVTWHYWPTRTHKVVDRYEKGVGVDNMDVVDIPDTVKYRRIVAISTIEHVGFDEVPRDPKKIAQALRVLSGLLVPGGEALITIPIGYNPLLDADLHSGAVSFDEMAFLRRRESGWGWREAKGDECWDVPYTKRTQAGNALVVGFLRRSEA